MDLDITEGISSKSQTKLHEQTNFASSSYLHELSNVELWCFQDLHLADEDILQGEYARGGFLDFLSNDLRDELGHKLFQITS